MQLLLVRSVSAAGMYLKWPTDRVISSRHNAAALIWLDAEPVFGYFAVHKSDLYPDDLFASIGRAVASSSDTSGE